MVMAVGTANIHSISDRSSDSSRLVLVLCEERNNDEKHSPQQHGEDGGVRRY